jgi:hypothetical protein
MDTTTAATCSTLEDLPRTADRLFDDAHLPAEIVGIRAQARDFATSVLLPRAAD